MDITVALIRGVAGSGGMQGRFMGQIDEPPARESLERLDERISKGIYPEAKMVFSGGHNRCLATARRIYPAVPTIVIPGLAAFDYGDFSGKTYPEIISDERFDAWARPDRAEAFPGGEDPHAFAARCVLAFIHIMKEAEKKKIDKIAVVTHLAVIGAIARRYVAPRSPYRDWPAEHCGGYSAVYDTQRETIKTIASL